MGAYIIVSVLILITSILLMLVVLVQNSKGGGLASNFSGNNQYMGVRKTADFLEFSKGDSHQMLFDYCTSDDFDYCNYPAFSPSSEWVQTNFKKGRSGFVFSTIEFDSNIKEIKPYFF